ncbi:MAG TPA: polysaccharide lyase family 7 protein [Candidatus Saccharimonadales bacterium]|nr:polysaccharide lyase family 7 protein [Candidatus Saccharimonadales bacterium]
MSSKKAVMIIVLVFLGVFITGYLTSADKPETSSMSGEDAYTNETSNNTASEEPNAGVQPGTSAVSSRIPPALTPARIINLNNWKLTLPINTGYSGNPDEIKQPALTKFTKPPYFRVNSAKNGVIFRAHTGGATTSNSGYPRSELREMRNNGRLKASWYGGRGSHTMTIRQAITHLPRVKPHVVAGQIHDASDDVMMIRLERKHLFVESDGDNVGTLDKNYSLGKAFTVKVHVYKGKITVYYNGSRKVSLSGKGSGYYFKAGCYTQSNPSKGDSPSDYGEVTIYSLNIRHT